MLSSGKGSKEGGKEDRKKEKAKGHTNTRPKGWLRRQMDERKNNPPS